MNISDSLTGISEPAFCVRLTWTLFHLAWQGLAAGAFSAAVAVCLRRQSANLRYMLHVAALFVLAMCLSATYLWIGVRPGDATMNDRPATAMFGTLQPRPPPLADKPLQWGS